MGINRAGRISFPSVLQGRGRGRNHQADWHVSLSSLALALRFGVKTKYLVHLVVMVTTTVGKQVISARKEGPQISLYGLLRNRNPRLRAEVHCAHTLVVIRYRGSASCELSWNTGRSLAAIVLTCLSLIQASVFIATGLPSVCWAILVGDSFSLRIGASNP